jgi:hypothetical protein
MASLRARPVGDMVLRRVVWWRYFSIICVSGSDSDGWPHFALGHPRIPGAHRKNAANPFSLRSSRALLCRRRQKDVVAPLGNLYSCSLGFDYGSPRTSPLLALLYTLQLYYM